MTRLLLSLIVMLPLLVDTSVPCPEPDYPSVTDCPFAVDPNLIQGKLLGWAQVEVGQQLAHTRTWCDPDGDPARAEIIAGPDDARLINKPKIKSYTILWRPTHPVTTAIVIRLTDNPITGQPQSDVGTLWVQAVPKMKQQARGRCGGQPG